MKETIFASLLMLALQSAELHAVEEPQDNSPAAEQAIAESISAALQGDGRRAREALATVPAEQFSPKDAGYLHVCSNALPEHHLLQKTSMIHSCARRRQPIKSIGSAR
jgi:hypothetical protein